MDGWPFKLRVRRRQPCDDLGKAHSGTVNGERTGPVEGPSWNVQEWKAVELKHNQGGRAIGGKVNHVRRGSGQDGGRCLDHH